MSVAAPACCGTAGRATGFSDHRSLVTFAAATSICPGQFAPSAIHFSSSAICSGFSGSSFGGMIISGSVPFTASIKKLFFGSPGTTAGIPESPPFSMTAR